MALTQHPEKMRKGVIEDWHPEDKAFWEKTGQKIASRNLWISVPCLLYRSVYGCFLVPLQ